MNRIFFPWQRVIRTAVQVVVAAASILAVTVVVAPQIIEAVAEVIPGSWVAWLTGAVAVLAAVSAALARIMAIPQVDAFLRKFGAGSSPEGSIAYTDITGETVPLTRRQFRALIADEDDAPSGVAHALANEEGTRTAATRAVDKALGAREDEDEAAAVVSPAAVRQGRWSDGPTIPNQAPSTRYSAENDSENPGR